MSKDQIRTDAEAVRSLRRGLERFGDQIRLAASDARREMQHRERDILQEQGRRQAELRRRELEVQVIQSELARCREGCEGLMAALRRAAGLRSEAADACVRAQKAAEVAAEAKSELTRVLLKIEGTVDEHSKLACAALSAIEKQIAELRPTQTTGLAAVTVTLATIAQVASAAPNFAQLGANLAAGLGHSNALANSSIIEAGQESHQQLVGYWADDELERRKRESGTVEGSP